MFQIHQQKMLFWFVFIMLSIKDAGRQDMSVSSLILGVSLNSSKYIMALEEGKKIAVSRKRSGS